MSRYWEQFDRDDLMSMQGAEDGEDDTDMERDEDDTILEQEFCSCHRGCSNCL